MIWTVSRCDERQAESIQEDTAVGLYKSESGVRIKPIPFFIILFMLLLLGVS